MAASDIEAVKVRLTRVEEEVSELAESDAKLTRNVIKLTTQVEGLQEVISRWQSNIDTFWRETHPTMVADARATKERLDSVQAILNDLSGKVDTMQGGGDKTLLQGSTRVDNRILLAALVIFLLSGSTQGVTLATHLLGLGQAQVQQPITNVEPSASAAE